MNTTCSKKIFQVGCYAELIFQPRIVEKSHDIPHAVTQLRGNYKLASSNILCIKLSVSGTFSSQALICTDSAASVQTLGTIVQTQMRKGVCTWTHKHTAAADPANTSTAKT